VALIVVLMKRRIWSLIGFPRAWGIGTLFWRLMKKELNTLIAG